MNFTFDKFMVDIVNREEQVKEKNRDYQSAQEESPARAYNQRYRENWMNSTFFSPGRGRWQK
jgi:hypothetical protein